MGIIAKQSVYNVLSIALAFGIGAANMLFLYPKYPGKEFQGLIVALLANSNLIQPFISFGVQHTLIKYFSNSESEEEKDRLLWFAILFPLLILALIFPLYNSYSNQILDFLSNSNKTILRFPVLILSVAIATAYFEIFFSWLRVHLQSVFGNFLKEVYPRLLTLVLLLLYVFGTLDLDNFIVYLIVGYYLRLVVIGIYCFKVDTPSFQFKLPKGWQKMLRYSTLIFLSGAAASFILDIDKSMIFSLSTNENVAFYAVALYIAAVIEAPGRAMFQITSPLVARALNDNNEERLLILLKKSSLNLMIVCGIVFLLINLNLNYFYLIIDQEGYASAASVVIIVSIGKFFSMSMGCLNNIISNSKTLSIEIQNPNNIDFDSIQLTLDTKKIATSVDLSVIPLGEKRIKAKVFYDGTFEVVLKKVIVVNSEAPKLYTYEIINTYPHDITSYTQGLEFYKGDLYESTGQYGESKLRKLDYKKGAFLKTLI